VVGTPHRTTHRRQVPHRESSHGTQGAAALDRPVRPLCLPRGHGVGMAFEERASAITGSQVMPEGTEGFVARVLVAIPQLRPYYEAASEECRATGFDDVIAAVAFVKAERIRAIGPVSWGLVLWCLVTYEVWTRWWPDSCRAAVAGAGTDGGGGPVRAR
jgi:hypothetical protein